MFSLRKKLEKRDLETLDLFTISFSLFKSNFINFLYISMICSIPIILISAYYPKPIFNYSKIETIEDIINFFRNEVDATFYINLLLSWFLDVISIVSISLLVESLIYKKIKSATWAIKKSFKIFIPALITSFIYLLLVFFGFLFFIVPGIFLIVLFSFYQNICALRHTWGIEAFKYSYNLIKYKFFKALFIISFIFLFENVFVISFLPNKIDSREEILYYFISMILLNIFDTYFKVILTLFFLNRDFVISNNTENNDN